MMGDVPFHAVLVPLVGRETELEELTGLVGLGPDAHPGAVLLGGDAGVGKTRVLAELRSRAQEAGWTVLPYASGDALPDLWRRADRTGGVSGGRTA